MCTAWYTHQVPHAHSHHPCAEGVTLIVQYNTMQCNAMQYVQKHTKGENLIIYNA